MRPNDYEICTLNLVKKIQQIIALPLLLVSMAGILIAIDTYLMGVWLVDGHLDQSHAYDLGQQ